MKKSFLFLLISIMTVFLIAGCAEDTTNGGTGNNGGSTGGDELVNQLKNYAGNYELLFFYTNGAGMLPISSDCSKVEQYIGKADSNCVVGVNDVEFQGYGTITVADNGDVSIVTKMQMTNESLKKGEKFWAFAQNNQYTYTNFTTIPASTIDINTMTLNVVNPVKGVTGRNMKTITPAKASDTTYTFQIQQDGTIKNQMVDTSSLAPANVTVIMKKINTLPVGITMDANVKFDTPVIEGFLDEPNPAPSM